MFWQLLLFFALSLFGVWFTKPKEGQSASWRKSAYTILILWALIFALWVYASV